MEKENLDNSFQRLIPISIKNNKLTEHGITADQLYGTNSILFNDNRTLNIRWIKIPTFQQNNNQYYYTVFLNDIELWRKGEIKQIKKQSLECCNTYNMDSYTIFQVGRFHGRFELNENIKFHNTYIFNVETFTNKQETLFYNLICNFLNRRIQKMDTGGLVFGTIREDIRRLERCIDILNSISTINISSNVSSTTNTSTNILVEQKKRRRR